MLNLSGEAAAYYKSLPRSVSSGVGRLVAPNFRQLLASMHIIGAAVLIPLLVAIGLPRESKEPSIAQPITDASA